MVKVTIRDNRAPGGDEHAETRFTAWTEGTANDWVQASTGDSLDSVVDGLLRYAMECTDGYLEAIGPDGVRVVVGFPGDPTCPSFSLRHHWVNGQLVFVRDPLTYWTFNVVN